MNSRGGASRPLNGYEFIICCGYKGYVIKEYFANYFLHTSDVTFDMSTNAMEVHSRKAEPWRVTLVDTGDSTLTGGRLRRVREHIGAETFCFTYGDGVADVDLHALRFPSQGGPPRHPHGRSTSGAFRLAGV